MITGDMVRPNPSGREHNGGHMRFVPGEVCLVVESDDGAAAASYSAVLTRLNQVLGARVGTFAPASAGSFAPDVAMQSLKQYFAGGGQQLLLPRNPIQPSDDKLLMPEPSLAFPDAKSGHTTALHFYGIDPHSGDSTQVVRDLVNLVNVDPPALMRLVQEEGRVLWTVAAATPNWLIIGAPSDDGSGGPGSRPEPAPAGRWDFEFRNGSARQAREAGNGDGILVAVLDTSPTLQQVQTAANRYQQPAAQHTNDLLHDVTAHLSTKNRIEGPLSIDPAYFRAKVPNVAANVRHIVGLRPTDTNGVAYEMPDHGLFSVGIVHRIAPAAEIHLIRVLGDHGVGTTEGIAAVIRRLPGGLPLDGKKLVVNLSLMADLPPGVGVEATTAHGAVRTSAEFVAYLFPESVKLSSAAALAALIDPAAPPIGPHIAVKRAVELTHESINRVMKWLGEHPLPDNSSSRRLLVAAAGNDALGQPAVPQTRLPARYDHILGVAAVNLEGRPSQFSNRGDEQSIGDGIATFGGDASHVPPGNATSPVLIDTSPGPGSIDAVVGIFSAPQFPFNTPLPATGGGAPASAAATAAATRTNDTGWAYWSGTSFATPIISALAACVWSRTTTLGSRGVINTITAMAGGTTANHPTLGCPIIRVHQIP